MLLSQRMNYINRPKSAYTQEERIKYLEESIRELRKEKENLKKEKGELKTRLEGENKKQKEENELLKQCLDKLMFDADIVNVKIHWEIWDYVYVRSDKQFKLNVKE